MDGRPSVRPAAARPLGGPAVTAEWSAVPAPAPGDTLERALHRARPPSDPTDCAFVAIREREFSVREREGFMVIPLLVFNEARHSSSGGKYFALEK